MTKNHFLPMIGPAVLFSLAACGGSDAPRSGGEPAATAAAPSPIDTMTFASELNIDLKQFTRTASGLYYRDLVVGDGAEVLSGKMVSVYYVGMLANGQIFDSATPDGGPVAFAVGVGRLIQGWDEGIPGMKVGGKRQLIVPPELGYGSMQNGPIPANATLVFTVDVVDTE